MGDCVPVTLYLSSCGVVHLGRNVVYVVVVVNTSPLVGRETLSVSSIYSMQMSHCLRKEEYHLVDARVYFPADKDYSGECRVGERGVGGEKPLCLVWGRVGSGREGRCHNS